MRIIRMGKSGTDSTERRLVLCCSGSFNSIAVVWTINLVLLATFMGCYDFSTSTKERAFLVFIYLKGKKTGRKRRQELKKKSWSGRRRLALLTTDSWFSYKSIKLDPRTRINKQHRKSQPWFLLTTNAERKVSRRTKLKEGLHDDSTQQWCSDPDREFESRTPGHSKSHTH